MSDAPKSPKFPRRWLTFSLRTMFILVTLLCCWLGWESNIVRQRQSLVKELRTRPHFQVTTAQEWGKYSAPGSHTPKVASVSLVRRLLGDEAIQEIGYRTYSQPPPGDELARLARVFPEASVYEIPVPLEPCHPGCFPRGTLVDISRGRQLIETIQAGDVLTTILPSGEPSTATVASVFVTTNVLWSIRTETGILLTTKIQPLCLADGKIKAAGELQAGDLVLHREGEKIRAVQVMELTSTLRTEQVFNVVLEDGDIFVAGGYLARSKPPLEIAAK